MVGYIDGSGHYHPGQKSPRANLEASSQYKSWSHDQQRADRRYELIQPWTKDGKPNPEFREMYPDESKNYYGENR